MTHDGRAALAVRRSAPSAPSLDLPRRLASTAAGTRIPTAVVITGSYGAGHDSAAREICLRLRGDGWDVTVLDIATLYPAGLGHLLRRAYFAQLQIAPATWRSLLRALDRQAEGRGPRTSALIGRVPARNVALALGDATDLVISTHPFASQALGHLRQQGLLDVPVVTYLTDASVHPLWVHPAVDLHLAVHDEAARQARLRRARLVRVVQPLTPLVPPATGQERRLLRARLGLPEQAPIALLSGGSEGVGTIRAAARDVRDTGAATPVVLCGHNDRLRRSLEREDGIMPVGWLHDLTSVIRASDCVIQNSGGFTTLETLALGVPLVSYRCLPGHGEASAEALLVEGLAFWPQTRPELGLAISTAIARGVTVAPDRWLARPSMLEALPGAAPVELVG